MMRSGILPIVKLLDVPYQVQGTCQLLHTVGAGEVSWVQGAVFQIIGKISTSQSGSGRCGCGCRQGSGGGCGDGGDWNDGGGGGGAGAR